MSKLKEWKAALWGTPTYTWAAHAYMTAIPALGVAAALALTGVLLGTHAQLCYLGLTFAMALFYAFREQGDEMHHRMRGDYDKPQANQGVLTSRIDKIGDSFGPFLTTIVAGATVAVGTWPWVAVGICGVATAAMIRAAARIIRRPNPKPSKPLSRHTSKPRLPSPPDSSTRGWPADEG